MVLKITHCPFFVFDEERKIQECIGEFPEDAFEEIESCLEECLKNKNISFFPYIVSRQKNMFITFLKDKENKFYAVGPVVFEKNLTDYGQQDYKVSYCKREVFGSAVLILHHMLTGEEIPLEKLWKENTQCEELVQQHAKQFGAVLFERMENENPHNPYDQEVRELDSIRNGDLESFQKSIIESYSGQEGKLSEDQLRQEKNIAICVITLASRAAIDGGILPEIAFSMVDAYILQIERMTDVIQIRAFMREAEKDFLLKVQAYQQQKEKNPIIEQTKNYIFQHMHSQQHIGEMSRELGINASYLSDLFHKTEGITIQKYIQREKIKLAQNMLKYSGYRIEEIANYLGFCTQSYFGKVFLEWTGMSPKQYRLKYERKS